LGVVSCIKYSLLEESTIVSHQANTDYTTISEEMTLMSTKLIDVYSMSSSLFSVLRYNGNFDYVLKDFWLV
jgi:hypothetical protein